MTGSQQSQTLESRVSAALRVLAETTIPEGAEHDEPRSPRSVQRWLVAVAAAAVVVCGGIGLVLLRSDSGADVDRPVATQVDVSDEAAPTVSASPPTVVDVGETTPSIEVPEELGVVAILDPAAGFGPGQTPGAVDRWLAGAVEPERFAIQGRDTADPVVLRWAMWPASEWSKSYSDQPDVELPNGQLVKRLIPTYVDVVNYAIETDGAVFSASIETSAEAELAQWFGDVADDDFMAISPPEGFVPVASSTARVSAMYEQATIETVAFDAPIELFEFVETRMPDYSFEPIGDQGAVIGRPPEVDGRSPTVVWQPAPDLIVSAGGAADTLERIADALVLADVDSADLGVMASQLGPNTSGDPDVTILGETDDGRFAYTQTLQADGSACQWFVHLAFGGGGGCDDGPSRTSRPNCSTSWEAPDQAVASVFVIADDEPDIEFVLDGQSLDPKIETGGDSGVQWFFAHARAGNRASGDSPIRPIVNQSVC
ncbi:MAG: hypothetical protein AAFY28_00315 [Actinomycetota bacterium]